MAALLFLILVGMAVSGLIGYAIGNGKGRGRDGFLLGAFLGWVGWIITAILRPDVEHEARRAVDVARATQRLSGASSAPAAPNFVVGGARRPSPASNDMRTHAAPLERAAESESDRDRLRRAIHQMTMHVRPTRPIQSWVFGDGRYALAVAYDGRVHVCNADGCVALPTKATRTFDQRPDGTIVNIVLDDVVLENVRPQHGARTLVGSAAPVRYELPALEVAPAPASPVEPAAAELPPPASPGAPSVADLLLQVEQLHRSGLLTEDEYQTKKAQLLDRL